VALVTGNGLKDVPSAIQATGEPHRVEPTLEALRRLMSTATIPSGGAG